MIPLICSFLVITPPTYYHYPVQFNLELEEFCKEGMAKANENIDKTDNEYEKSYWAGYKNSLNMVYHWIHWDN